MRKLVLLLCLLCLAVQAEPARIVTLANGEWPPYLSAALPGGGSVSRLVSEAFATQGVEVRYHYFPWARAFEEARDGRLDGTVVWSRTTQREAEFLYSEPVVTTDILLFYAKARPVQWQSLHDLAGLRLGGALGYANVGEYGQLVREGVLKVEVAESDEQNLVKLAAGHIDAVGVDKDVALYLLSTHLRGIADRIAFDPKPIATVPHYLLISKKVPDAEALVHQFNAGLAALRAESPGGTVQ